MLEMARRTWLPTLLFGLPVWFYVLIPRPSSPDRWWWVVLTLAPLMAVPPIWWAFAASRGRISLRRGAVVGGVCGASLGSLYPALLMVITIVSRITGNDPAGYGGVFLIVLLPFCMGIFIASMPVGALLGVFAALVEGPD